MVMVMVMMMVMVMVMVGDDYDTPTTMHFMLQLRPQHTPSQAISATEWISQSNMTCRAG
jgi:hypothetical protein